MGTFDTITWQALTAVLTLAGLVGTVVFWRLRGPVAGLRMLALTLLPAAAYLTGTLRLLWEVADAVVGWAVRLTFSPAVWLGIALAVTSLLVFSLAGLLRRRGVGQPKQLRGAAGDKSLASQAPESASGGRRQPARSDAGDDLGDMDDIEQILKRHGIT